MRVALRKESVDRNLMVPITPSITVVALRKESVDRNIRLAVGIAPQNVALRKESVDRNPGGRRPRNSPDSRSPQGERG